MVEPILLIVLGFFVMVSFLDWKFKAVPSILMTGMLFVVAIINIKNLNFAIFSLILAVILSELDEHRGLADTKATIIIGFMIPTFQMFITYVILLVCFQFIYVMVFKIKFPEVKEYPFLPVYLLTYFILLVGLLI